MHVDEKKGILGRTRLNHLVICAIALFFLEVHVPRVKRLNGRLSVDENQLKGTHKFFFAQILTFVRLSNFG